MAGYASTMVQTTRTMVRTALGLKVFGSNSKLNNLWPIWDLVRFASSSDAAKRAIDELKNVGNQMKEKAASVASQTKEATGASENIADKAKQSAQEAWSATKDTAQKVQNTVAGKAEESAGSVKDHIEAAKRSFNTKK